MTRKRKFVSIHQEVKERRRQEDDSSADDTASTYHLASQYLADSSLSEDVSQYLSMSLTAGVGIALVIWLLCCNQNQIW